MQNSTECAGNIQSLVWHPNAARYKIFLQHFLTLCYFIQAVNSELYIVESNLEITVQGVLIFSRCITASIPVWYGMSGSDTKNFKRPFPVVIEWSLSESSTVCKSTFEYIQGTPIYCTPLYSLALLQVEVSRKQATLRLTYFDEKSSFYYPIANYILHSHELE